MDEPTPASTTTRPAAVTHASNLRGGTACSSTPGKRDRVLATLNPRLVDCPPCKARLDSAHVTVTQQVGDDVVLVKHSGTIDASEQWLEEATLHFTAEGTYVEHARRQVQTAHGLVSMVLACYWPNRGMAPARGAQQILDSLDTTQWSHE